MGHIAGTPFGIGSQFMNPLQQTAWGFSPYNPQTLSSYQTAASQIQPILQSLQVVTHQLQQLQQQLLVQQQQQQLPLGIPALPFQTQPPLFAGQPGQVM